MVDIDMKEYPMTKKPTYEKLEQQVKALESELLKLKEEDKKLRQEVIKHKRAEEAIGESDDRFFKAFNLNPSPVTISTLKEGRIIDVNESFLRVLGYSREEVVGFTTQELKIWVGPEERTKLVNNLELESIASLPVLRVRSKSGEIRIFRIEFEKIGLNGEECLISTSTDVTEWKLAEKALRESEKKYRQLFGLISDSIFLIENESGNILVTFKSYGTEIILEK